MVQVNFSIVFILSAVYAVALPLPMNNGGGGRDQSDPWNPRHSNFHQSYSSPSPSPATASGNPNLSGLYIPDDLQSYSRPSSPTGYNFSPGQSFSHPSLLTVDPHHHDSSFSMGYATGNQYPPAGHHPSHNLPGPAAHHAPSQSTPTGYNFLPGQSFSHPSLLPVDPHHGSSLSTGYGTGNQYPPAGHLPSHNLQASESHQPPVDPHHVSRSPSPPTGTGNRIPQGRKRVRKGSTPPVASGSRLRDRSTSPLSRSRTSRGGTSRGGTSRGGTRKKRTRRVGSLASNDMGGPAQKEIERPYPCTHDNCGKAFARDYQRKRHEKTHTGERPYACTHDSCFKTFTRNADRERHEKTHDENRWTTVT